MRRALSVAFVLSITGLASAQGDPGAPPPPPDGAAPAPAPAEAAPPPAAQPAPAPAPAAAPPPMMGPPPGPPPEEGGARTHDGFFMRLGLDFGPLILSAKADVGGSEIKYSGAHVGFDLMFGGSPVEGLAIGGALMVNQTRDPKIDLGGTSVDSKGTLYVSGVGVFGDFYPDPHGGLNIQALVGYSAVSFTDDNGNSSNNDPTGLLLGAGVGYDFWVADEWSIGPIARVLYGNMKYEAFGAKVTYSYVYPSIGVGFTLH
jgi:hypothetical protein